MKIVDIFLNALQNKINVGDSQISDFEVKKNNIMAIKNIFYSHEIIKDEIDFNDLISFSDDEVKEILTILDKDKVDLLFKTFVVYKPLVLMYDKIKAKFGGEFEAPQYIEATKWLKDITDKVNNYIKGTVSRNEEYINDLKNDSSYYSKYYNLFVGNELVSPIGDFKEFNELLDKLNFNDEEKYEIKKFIGISNIKLMSNGYTDMMANEFDKYKVILRSKRNKYNLLFNFLKDKGITFDNVNVLELCNELKADEYDVRQALAAVFIENIFKKVNDGVLNINEAIIELEKILDFSREVSPQLKDDIKEEAVTHDNDNDNEELEVKEVTKKENKEDKIIIEAEEIIKNEKELINSINEEEFSKYLAQSINENTNESIKYQIVSILLALHSELEKYNNVKELEHARKMIITNIKDYIDAYKTLKSKLESK